MKSIPWTILVLTLIATPPLGADEPASLPEAIKKGEVTLNLRYRYETVDEDSFDKEARASTLRTALAYRSLAYKGWSLFLEAENVLDVGLEDEANNAGAGGLSNRVRDRPVIADPELTEVNQAYLRFERGKLRLDLGRQEIKLGDQRFVGAVGWRQNHQSFDAARLDYSGWGKTKLTYAFLENTNRIFGDDKPMASHLLNLGWDLGFGKLTLYGYLLDYDRRSDSVFSTTTTGVELKGEHAIGKGALLYEGELAVQQDAGDNPNEVDAGYMNASLGARLPVGITLKAAFEVLEGDPREGRFTTPLATLHAFNGWADKFLLTPSLGLEDLSLSLSGTAGKLAWTAVYHDFAAESRSFDYGQELDLLLTYKTSWKQVFGLKAAFYDADAFSTDTDKIWLWTAYTF